VCTCYLSRWSCQGHIASPREWTPTSHPITSRSRENREFFFGHTLSSSRKIYISLKYGRGSTGSKPPTEVAKLGVLNSKIVACFQASELSVDLVGVRVSVAYLSVMNYRPTFWHPSLQMASSIPTPSHELSTCDTHSPSALDEVQTSPSRGTSRVMEFCRCRWREWVA